jgi:hypothetical protein
MYTYLWLDGSRRSTQQPQPMEKTSIYVVQSFSAGHPTYRSSWTSNANLRTVSSLTWQRSTCRISHVDLLTVWTRNKGVTLTWSSAALRISLKPCNQPVLYDWRDANGSRMTNGLQPLTGLEKRTADFASSPHSIILQKRTHKHYVSIVGCRSIFRQIITSRGLAAANLRVMRARFPVFNWIMCLMGCKFAIIWVDRHIWPTWFLSERMMVQLASYGNSIVYSEW